MKLHPLAEGEFQGAVVEPAPSGGQTRHQLAILVELEEVLEDIVGNPRPVRGMFIHDPQFSTRDWNLFPNATVAPPEGDEHKDNTANDQLFHGCPSLVYAILYLQEHAALPPLWNSCRDIMTSNGGRLTPDGTRVSLLETRAACCRNSNSQLGGQPCRSLAHSLSEWMSTKRPLP